MTLIDKAEAHDNDLIRRGDALAAVKAHDFRWEASDAIAALPARGVGVKPLVWVESKFCGQDAFYADTPFGVWSVICYSGRGFRWTSVDTSGDNSDQDWTTADEAKSEAQAEYESRILDAIEHDVAKKLQPLAWDVDGRRLHMDDTMSFSKSYDWDGYECFRQEGYGLGASYIIWPDSITSKTWNLYGTADGLFVTDLNGADAAKAAAQADYEARILAAVAPTDAAHVNETPKSEHDAGNVLTDADLIARLREIQGQAGLFASAAADRIETLVKYRDAYAEMERIATEALRKAEARAERLEAALVEHNDLLRSALAIAKREGVEGQIASTNWDAYYNRVAVVLKRHHQTANEARATITEATDDPR